MNDLIYIHGFNSSKNSSTVKTLRSNFPDLDIIALEWNSRDSFVNNIVSLSNDVKSLNIKDFFFVGTSMGGLYASILAKKFHKMCVLFNPVIDPIKTLSEINRISNIHVLYDTGEKYVLTEDVVNSYSEVPDVRDSGLPVYIILGMNDHIVDPNLTYDYWKSYAAIIKVNNMEHRVNDFTPFSNILNSNAVHMTTD